MPCARTQRTAAASVSVVAALALGACTGGGGPEPSTAPTRPAPTTTASTGHAVDTSAATYTRAARKWAGAEATDLRAASTYAKSIRLVGTETIAQQRQLGSACAAGEHALRTIAAPPALAPATSATKAYTGAQRLRSRLRTNAASARRLLTQLTQFCRLYDAAIPKARHASAIRHVWDRRYTAHGFTTARAATPPSAALYEKFTDQEAGVLSGIRSHPSPFPGAVWARMWKLGQAELTADITGQRAYHAALASGSSVRVGQSSRQYAHRVAKVRAAIVAFADAHHAEFPASVVRGYQKDGPTGASGVVYFAQHHLSEVGAQLAALATAITQG